MTTPTAPALVSALPENTRGLVLTCRPCQARTPYLLFGNGVALCSLCGDAQHQCHGKCGDWTSTEFALCERCEAVRD